MKIVFSTHARTSLLLRGIDAWKAKEIVKSPSWKKVQEDGTVLARKTFEGKTIEVVYIQKGETYLIKTLYYED